MRKRTQRHVYIDYRLILKVMPSTHWAVKYFPTFSRWFGVKPVVERNMVEVANSLFIRDNFVHIAFLDKNDPHAKTVYEMYEGKSLFGYQVDFISSVESLRIKHKKFMFMTDDLSLTPYFKVSEFMYMATPNETRNPQHTTQEFRIDP